MRLLVLFNFSLRQIVLSYPLDLLLALQTLISSFWTIRIFQTILLWLRPLLRVYLRHKTKVAIYAVAGCALIWHHNACRAANRTKLTPIFASIFPKSSQIRTVISIWARTSWEGKRLRQTCRTTLYQRLNLRKVNKGEQVGNWAANGPPDYQNVHIFEWEHALRLRLILPSKIDSKECFTKVSLEKRLLIILGYKCSFWSVVSYEAAKVYKVEKFAKLVHNTEKFSQKIS